MGGFLRPPAKRVEIHFGQVWEETGGERGAQPSYPFTGSFPLKREGIRQPGMARLLGAVVRHRYRLLEEDPRVPFPQKGCTFLFGRRRAPLPLGALVLL